MSRREIEQIVIPIKTLLQVSCGDLWEKDTHRQRGKLPDILKHVLNHSANPTPVGIVGINLKSMPSNFL